MGYIAKPFPVTVYQVQEDNLEELAELTGGRKHREAYRDDDGWCLDSPTLMLATGQVVKRGHFVVDTPAGFVACDPHAFMAMFESWTDVRG